MSPTLRKNLRPLRHLNPYGLSARDRFAHLSYLRVALRSRSRKRCWAAFGGSPVGSVEPCKLFARVIGLRHRVRRCRRAVGGGVSSRQRDDGARNRRRSRPCGRCAIASGALDRRRILKQTRRADASRDPLARRHTRWLSSVHRPRGPVPQGIGRCLNLAATGPQGDVPLPCGPANRSCCVRPSRGCCYSRVTVSWSRIDAPEGIAGIPRYSSPSSMS